jgi:hypothetical protein
MPVLRDRQRVLENRLMPGSVNAACADELQQPDSTRRTLQYGLMARPQTLQQFVAPQDHHEPDSIKQVVQWKPASTST